MKTKISFVLIISICFGSFSIKAQNNNGFGVKQTQGILKGILLGGAIGGALGNQKDKSIEGALIGGTIGAMIGNQTGRNQDVRRQKEQQNLKMEKYRNQIAIQDQPIMSVRNNNFSKEKSIRKSNYPTVHANNDLEILVARQRAEKAEFELRRYEEQKRRQVESKNLLLKYHARERLATQKIFEFR